MSKHPMDGREPYDIVQDLLNTAQVFVDYYFQTCDSHSQKNHAVASIRHIIEEVQRKMPSVKNQKSDYPDKNEIPF